jgi:hypothetical protein
LKWRPDFAVSSTCCARPRLSHDVDYELLKALIATESGVRCRRGVAQRRDRPDAGDAGHGRARYGVSADRRASIEQKLADPAINIGARHPAT